MQMERDIMLNNLIVFHQLREDPVIKGINALSKNPDNDGLYYEAIRRLSKLKVTFKEHVYRKMIQIEHPIITSLILGQEEAVDMHMIKHDLSILAKWFSVDMKKVLKLNPDGYHLIKSVFEADNYEGMISDYDKMLQTVTNKGISVGYEVYKKLLLEHGNGIYALYQAFYVDADNSIKPIADYDHMDWADIYGYESQKLKLDQNTKAFIEGVPSHHALLVGASGTGKSSSVKALIHKYASKKLRLIQLDKKQLRHLPDILKLVENSCFKFIVFMDDLSFEVNEDDYKFVKSFIEGGVKKDAKNVAFYVTSNRRHLIKEIRSERENDIHLNDFISEMTSLSDRFGLTLFYDAPVQKLYFEMVENMLNKKGLDFDEEKTLLAAKQWSLRHGGMSGRVAEQFVKHAEMESKIQN